MNNTRKIKNTFPVDLYHRNSGSTLKEAYQKIIDIKDQINLEKIQAIQNIEEKYKKDVESLEKNYLLLLALGSY